MIIKSVARNLYAVYRTQRSSLLSTEGGVALPGWDDLHENEREAWCAVAQAAIADHAKFTADTVSRVLELEELVAVKETTIMDLAEALHQIRLRAA